MIRRIVAGALWLCAALASPAQLIYQPAFQQPARQALAHMYNMDFDQARQGMNALLRQHPQAPVCYFMISANYWWMIMANMRNTALDDSLMWYIEKTISLAEAQLEKNAKDNEAEFMYFAGNAFKARAQAVRGNMFAAAKTALKCIPSMKRGNQYKGMNFEFLFGSGMYQYYAEWYPEQRPIVRPFMIWFPKGNKALGLQELEACARTPNYTSTEAAFYLIEIYLFTERKYAQALLYTRKLTAEFPGSALFRMYHAQCLYLNGQIAEAQTLCESLMQEFRRNAAGKRGVLNVPASKVTTQMMQTISLYYALCLQAGGKRYDEAYQQLRNADYYCQTNSEPESTLRARIALEMGLCRERNGRRDEALVHYQAALNLPNNDGVKVQAKACLAAPCIR